GRGVRRQGDHVERRRPEAAQGDGGRAFDRLLSPELSFPSRIDAPGAPWKGRQAAQLPWRYCRPREYVSCNRGEASMTVIRPERLSDVDLAASEAVNEVEGEIREFVRRDISVFRRPRQDNGDAAAENIGSLIQRVSAASVAEVERVIGELTTV